MMKLKNKIHDLKRNDIKVMTNFSVHNGEPLIDEVDTLTVDETITSLIEKGEIPKNLEGGLLVLFSDGDYMLRLK